jgi:hypothetical protein
MFGRREMQTALICGRRCAGKTALVRQALKEADTDWIYHECRENSDSQCLQLLRSYLSRSYLRTAALPETVF